MNRLSRPDGLVAGIDLGGTNMQIGIVDSGNSIIGRGRKKTKPAEGFEGVVKRIAKGVREACEEAAIEPERLDAVGIAAAGAMDLKKGIVLVSPNLNWKDVPLRSALESELDRPVVMENDVRGAAWGEHKLGAGRDRADMLAVWIGTGVGGGLILNGSIYHGEFGSAGEIGHTSVTPLGEEDMRTVEHRCSRTGMARMIRSRLDDHPDSPVWKITERTGQITGSKQFARALEAGCSLTRDVVNEAADILGIAIASAITLLAVDTVVLGGGVSEALGEPYLKRVRKSFERYVFPDRNRSCELLTTELKDDAGLLGAAMLARERIGLPNHSRT